MYTCTLLCFVSSTTTTITCQVWLSNSRKLFFLTRIWLSFNFFIELVWQQFELFLISSICSCCNLSMLSISDSWLSCAFVVIHVLTVRLLFSVWICSLISSLVDILRKNVWKHSRNKSIVVILIYVKIRSCVTYFFIALDEESTRSLIVVEEIGWTWSGVRDELHEKDSLCKANRRWSSVKHVCQLLLP